MKTITLDYSKALATIRPDEIEAISQEIKEAHNKLTNKTGAGNDYLGWIDLPNTYDKEEFARIKDAAAKIQEQAEVLIVIGIGGSYLGAKAAIDFLGTRFYNLKSSSVRKTPQIFFAGTSSSPTYLMELYNLVKDKELSLNVISKSGTTTEPAIAFRIFKKLMEEKYGKDGARERIFVTTDKERGALKDLANREGYETFVVPDDVGGRYSVLSAVGLLPIAVSGADIDEMMRGAQDACKLYASDEFDKNECYQYAGIRNLLYRQGKTMEIMANYEPRLHFVSEWWKQLYAESEGKDKKGIFTAAMDFSTDLHSMGQYVQDGLRNLFETVLHVEHAPADLFIPEDIGNVDGLDYLAGKPLSLVNDKAFLGAAMAHFDGGVPVMVINIPELSAYYFGQLVYFFEKACGISGYILGVNPFDQPGVEAYKRTMFALLGKPGYEEEKKVLEERLK